MAGHPLSRVVDHLAELTGVRDRDTVDATLVGALRDLLRPLALGIYRPVGEPGHERWLTRARTEGDDPTISADPLWCELDDLPALAAMPERVRCLHERRVVECTGPPAQLLLPVVTERETAGVLVIDNAEPLSERDRQMVAGILRVYRNFLGLLDYSERDTLTGLLNRKTFDEAFLRLAAAVSGAPAPPGTEERRRDVAAQAYLGVLDIDHFKRVNDAYGHLIGDEVLLLLARTMRGCFRFHDQLLRFGGEEFAVLLRCAEDTDARHAFERLRSTIETHPFPRVGYVTLSVGVTRLRAGDAPGTAFERADKAVYFAKQHGRNQVAVHEHLVASGVLADAARDSDVELF